MSDQTNNEEQLTQTAQPGRGEHAPVETEPAGQSLPQWPWWKRWGFRFSFLFILLVVFPFPLEYIPGAGGVVGPMVNLEKTVVSSIGERVFALSEPLAKEETGSGDRLYDYVRMAIYGMAAGLLTLLWSLLDRRRPAYPWAGLWLEVVARYWLAFNMISYGTAKFFGGQFSELSLSDLVQTYGQSSPMGFVWRYMGYSAVYCGFTGVGEILGGLLLFSKRTRTLGAAVCVAVMSNVFMLNMTFDIPVKLFSFELLLVAAGLMVLDGPRLVRVFLLNRPVEALSHGEITHRRPLRLAIQAGKVLVIFFFAYGFLFDPSVKEMRDKWAIKPAETPLYGIYLVDTMEKNGEALSLAEPHRWVYLIVERKEQAILQTSHGRRIYIGFDVNEEKHEVKFRAVWGEDPYIWTYQRGEAGRLHLAGNTSNHSYSLDLVPMDLKAFELLDVDSRFRWVQEYPYNR